MSATAIRQNYRDQRAAIQREIEDGRVGCVLDGGCPIHSNDIWDLTPDGSGHWHCARSTRLAPSTDAQKAWDVLVRTAADRATELDECRRMLHEAESHQPRNRAERRAWRKLNADNEFRAKHLRREVARLERCMLRDFGHA